MSCSSESEVGGGGGGGGTQRHSLASCASCGSPDAALCSGCGDSLSREKSLKSRGRVTRAIKALWLQVRPCVTSTDPMTSMTLSITVFKNGFSRTIRCVTNYSTYMYVYGFISRQAGKVNR